MLCLDARLIQTPVVAWESHFRMLGTLVVPTQ
jgi:hypothetical protein